MGERYAHLAQQFGIEADKAGVDRAFPAALARASAAWAAPDRVAGQVATWEQSFWRGLVRAIFEELGVYESIQPGRFDAYFSALYEHFATAEPWEVFADVVPALSRLRDAGFRLAVVSNFDTRIFRLLGELGLAPLFDSVVIPSAAGAAKPDPAIFRHALSVAGGVRAVDAVHIGDSLSDDVEAARRAGLGAILLDRDGRHRGQTGLVRIESLRGALEIVQEVRKQATAR